jgi:uncharacterized protein (TIGR03437 family)
VSLDTQAVMVRRRFLRELKGVNMRFAKWLVLAGLVAGAQGAVAATLHCVISAAPLMVRTEGLAEKVGDIRMRCTAGTPGAIVTAGLAVTLPVSITNRVTGASVADAALTADNGGGEGSTGATVTLGSSNTITFSNAQFTLSPTGTVDLRISNIRAAIAQLGSGNSTPVVATVSWGGGNTTLLFEGSAATVAMPFTGLYSATATTFVNCTGSPLPAAISVPELIAAGTARSVTRVSEGFWTAFEAPATGLDSGTRFILNLSRFPAGARVFVADAIAGSSASYPTSSGLLGRSATGGAYIAGSHTLLLVRIAGAKADGSGGTALYTASGIGLAVLNGASEVTLTNGAGTVVYEVADASTALRESAEIPIWLGLAATGGATSSPHQSLTLGPVSTVAQATATDPVPRFEAVEPGSDCTLAGDCASFPAMTIEPPTLEFTAVSGAAARGSWVWVNNTGGGTLSWSAYITYKNGSGWASLAFTTGAGGSGGVRVVVSPLSLDPGIYEATLTVDGGPSGLQNFPIKLTVTTPSADASGPQVNAVLHAATFRSGALVPGSLATLMGLRFGGTAVAVTFDSYTATLLYTGDKQINLEVPAALASKSTSIMTVTVDGRSSTPRMVNLTLMSPGIFANGILNQDNSRNSTSNPASGGSVIQIFATGLPSSDIGTITARIHDTWITTPEYAGPAPGLIGVQQVNLRLPEGWPAMTTSVALCATRNTNGVRTCGPESALSVK